MVLTRTPISTFYGRNSGPEDSSHSPSGRARMHIHSLGPESVFFKTTTLYINKNLWIYWAGVLNILK